ncbi:SiaC family regulatory phosphoprotein [Bacteroidota bacterium]
MIQRVEIPQTSKTPLIVLDPGKGKILIKGRYILHDVDERANFIGNVLENINIIFPQMVGNINVDVYYIYVNTGNLQAFFSIFKTIESLSTTQQNITINWYYEGDDDEDAIEKGEILGNLITLPVNLIDVGD